VGSVDQVDDHESQLIPPRLKLVLSSAPVKHLAHARRLIPQANCQPLRHGIGGTPAGHESLHQALAQEPGCGGHGEPTAPERRASGDRYLDGARGASIGGRRAAQLAVLNRPKAQAVLEELLRALEDLERVWLEICAELAYQRAIQGFQVETRRR